jgi:hypothetical protein
MCAVFRAGFLHGFCAVILHYLCMPLGVAHRCVPCIAHWSQFLGRANRNNDYHINNILAHGGELCMGWAQNGLRISSCYYTPP